MSSPDLSTRSCQLVPMFIQLNGRRLFALKLTPDGPPPEGAVLYLPPFAEEMNRCRNHVAATARRMAAQGLAVLMLDPYGTGESDGRLDEPDWQTWLDDAVGAARWLHSDTGQVPLHLWGVRTGALLAAEAADALAPLVTSLLFWQPVLDGKTFLNQYLRLRIASQLVKDGERETTESIRLRLASGERIEIAGYPLAGHMADSLATRRLDRCQSLTRLPVHWLDLTAKPDQPLALPAQKLLNGLKEAGAQVHLHAVVSPPIWQTYDRELAPELHEATAAVLGRGMAGAP